MPVLRVLVAVSLLPATGFAMAQVPATKPATARPATPKPAATTTSAATTDDGNPVGLSPFPTAPPSKAGLELKAIHRRIRSGGSRSEALSRRA